MYKIEDVYNPRTKDHYVTVTVGAGFLGDVSPAAGLLGTAKYHSALKTVVVNQYSKLFPFGKVMKYFADDNYEDIVRIEHTMMKRKELGL